MFVLPRAIFSVVFITVLSLTLSANAADKSENARQAAIKAASVLYPSYVQSLPGMGEYKDFGKVSRERAFRSAVVFPLSAGYILYNPINGITFLLINTGSGNKVLKGLTPSELFSLTGHSPLNVEDQHIDVMFTQVPKEIEKLSDAVSGMRADQLLDYIAKADGSHSPYPDEATDLITGPYIRGARYAECLNQIDGSKLERKLEADLLNSGGATFLKAGFDYLDFIPLSAKEGLVIQASKLGLFYVMSGVDMTGKCSITQSWYKTL